MVEQSERRERIAELDREIAELEAANEATPTWGAAVGARWERIKGARAERSRLSESGAVPESGPRWHICPGCVHVFQSAGLEECPAAPVSPAPQADVVRDALEPFATFGTNPDGDDLTSGLMRDRICDWFGLADFRRAREVYAALSQSPAAPGETSVCDHLLPQADQGCGTLVRETPHPATTIMRLMAYHFGVTDHPETFQDSEAVAIVATALVAAAEWQPIETIPQDGKEYLVRNERQGGVKRLIRWNRVQKMWNCKGEPILSMQDTHWLANMPVLRSLSASEEGKSDAN